MQETEHFHLKKPEDTDFVRVSDLNGNADAIDAKLHELATEVTPIARGGTGATNATDALVNLGALGTRTTTGPAYGPLVSVTAEGHAEQDGTPTPSDPKEIVVVRGHEVTGKTGRYVDLVVTADGTTTTTPIPLPSRGWVGSLPDGTHDSLSIDGAGKVTWELADAEIVFDGSESWGTVNNGKRVGISSRLLPAISNIRQQSSSTETFACYCTHFVASTPSKTWAGTQGISGQQGQPEIHIADGTGAMTVESWKTWLQSNPVTVLYPLATPTTEDMGYVDLPDIPEGAVVSIPELEGLGVESWTDDAVARYVRAWAARP